MFAFGSSSSFRRFLVAPSCAVLMVVSAACSSTPTYNGITELGDIQVGDITLPQVDETGASVPFTLKAEEDDVLAVFFGFTNCPDQCPTTLADISAAREELKGRAARVDVAFVTVDLERDTPTVVAQYVNRFGFASDGHALRPTDQAELSAATKKVFATSEITKDEAGDPQVGHTAWTYLVDDTGKVVLEWEYGTGATDMAHDLDLLLDNDGTVGKTGG